jgi:hypothetical protein
MYNPAMIATRPFWLTVIIIRVGWLAARLALIGLPYNSEYRYWWQAMRFFSDRGLFPYTHYWVEYPPIFPWLVAAIDRLSFGVEVLFWGFFAALIIAAEIAGLYALSVIAKAISPEAVCAVQRFALIFPPVYIFTGWWDTLPLACLLASTVLLLTRRERSAAALIGVGVMLKLFPGMLIPAAAGALPAWKRKITFGIITALTAAGVLLPFGAINPPMTIASLQNMASRPSWETIYALLDGYFSYGIVAAFADRLDPTMALVGSHASRLPTGWITLGFGLLFAGFFLRFWGASSPRGVAAALGGGLTLLLIYSKGYSPQYLMWIAPFVALSFPHKKGAAALGALLLLNWIEMPVYINFFPTQHGLLFFTVITRTLILAVLAWAFLKQAKPARQTDTTPTMP